MHVCMYVCRSVDILGNPLGLAKRLGRGVMDFIVLPLRGLLRGSPVAAIRGSLEGADSLYTNTAYGLADSLVCLLDIVSRSTVYPPIRNRLAVDQAHLLQPETCLT